MLQLLTVHFSAPRTAAEAPLVVQLGQFFADNASLTLFDMRVNQEEGAGSGGEPSVSLTVLINTVSDAQYPGGVPYYAAEFISTASQTSEAQANAFFAANPSFILVNTLVMQNKETRYSSRMRLIAIYQTAPFMSATNAPLELSGRATSNIASGAANTILDATDDTRARLPSVVNMSIRTWLRGGAALVTKSTDANGAAAYAAVGPNLFTPIPSGPGPNPPVFPDDAPLCPCCFRLTAVEYLKGEASCRHVPQLTFNSVCRSGTPQDIAKASATGTVKVDRGAGAVCDCTPLQPGWVWGDPDHFMFSTVAAFDGGFWMAVGFEDLGPSCADFDYNDSLWVMEFTRCGSLKANNCTVAAVGPPTTISAGS